MDNEKKPCCCCGTPAQPEAATAPAVDASAVPTESVTPSCCRHKDRNLRYKFDVCQLDKVRIFDKVGTFSEQWNFLTLTKLLFNRCIV